MSSCHSGSPRSHSSLQSCCFRRVPRLLPAGDMKCAAEHCGIQKDSLVKQQCLLCIRFHSILLVPISMKECLILVHTGSMHVRASVLGTCTYGARHARHALHAHARLSELSHVQCLPLGASSVSVCVQHLLTPISHLLDFSLNAVSRRFEYQVSPNHLILFCCSDVRSLIALLDCVPAGGCLCCPHGICEEVAVWANQDAGGFFLLSLC